MENKGNVISIFAGKRAQTTVADAPKPVAQEKAPEQVKPSFDDVMRQNQDNLDRMRKERLKANLAVLKSYRIKN